MMDLTPYTGKGFPGEIDRMIAEVPVRGIDEQQTKGMIRLCPETVATLYGPDYSPRRIRYQRGVRPDLEAVVTGFNGTPIERVRQAIDWTIAHVRHPHLAGPLAPDRAMSEEQLIRSCTGWCNEQTRVYVALLGVMEIPARICFVTHLNLRSGHTCAETFLDGRWVFTDVTFNVMVRLPDGRWAEGRDLAGEHRGLAHDAYRPRLASYFRHVLPFVENFPGWNSKDRPTVDAGGDLIGHVGIINYLPQGVTRG